MSNDMTGTYAVTFLVTVIISILLFLLLREFFCWYWKINQSVALLQEIRDLLTAPARSKEPHEQQRRCPKCGAQQPGGNTFCESCGEKVE